MSAPLKWRHVAALQRAVKASVLSYMTQVIDNQSDIPEKTTEIPDRCALVHLGAPGYCALFCLCPTSPR
jgi:hypothetical protein